MQVTVENTGALGRRLKVQIPSQEMKTAVQEKISEISQKAQVKGFRPGMVPMEEVKRRYGSKARQEALGDVIEKTLPAALKQEQLRPAGSPVVESVNDEDNKDLEFVVSFEVYPEITLTDFSQIKAEKYKAEINDQEIDNALDKVRNHFADWVVVDRAAREGDRVIVDYNSSMNGKSYENNQGKDVQIEIGSHRFIEGFEKGLIGVKQGEERELDLTFPPEWRIEKLAGKPVQFKVKVKAVTEKQIADLNAAFAKKIGATSADTVAIRNKIQDSLEKQVADTIESHVREQVTNALLKLNSFPIPKILIEREASLMHEELHQRSGDKAHTSCQHAGLAEQAEKRVALGLILNEVIKEQAIKPDEAKVKVRVAKLSQMFGNAEFIESMYHESDELLTGVRHAVMLEQALEWVMSKVSIVEKPISVDTLLKQEIEGRV
jgi:trigger factor